MTHMRASTLDQRPQSVTFLDILPLSDGFRSCWLSMQQVYGGSSPAERLLNGS